MMPLMNSASHWHLPPSPRGRQLASAPGPRRLGARIRVSGDSTLRLAHDTSPVAHLTNEARALFDGAGTRTRRPGPGGIHWQLSLSPSPRPLRGTPARGPGPGLPVPHHDPGPASALAPRATRIQGTYLVCTGTHARLLVVLEEKCDLRRPTSLAAITFLKLGGISHC